MKVWVRMVWGKPGRQEEVVEIKDRKSRSLEWRPLFIGKPKCRL